MLLLKRTRWVIGLGLLAAALALTAFAFLHVGTWLVLDDTLQPARAIVVFGGKIPFRAMEAAKLYKEGWAKEIWLTQGGLFSEDIVLEQMQIERTPEYAYSQMVLERLDVPSAAIRLIPGRNANTADEVRTVARELQQSGGDRIILVTSSYHTRRVKVLWRLFTGNHPEAIVRYTPDDAFDSSQWWRESSDATTVSREWAGLFNAWLGFPVKSEHW